jgi:outer membrane protein assembly factor BamB
MAHMFRKIAKATGVLVAALLLTGAVLYALGLRVIVDGGGSPFLAFVESDAARAEQISRHRQAQRTSAEAAPKPVEPAPADRGGAQPAASAAAPPTAAGGPAPAVPAPAAPYWTDFRGPRRDGHYAERPIQTNWPSGGLTPLWKEPAGGGYASFVIVGGRAFTIEQRGGEEVAAAYDVATGRELWTNRWTAAFRELMGGDGPRATPTWSDGHVYVLGAAGELRCLEDATGRVAWRTNILADAGATNLQWGMAASPLVVDDTVVVLPGGAGGRSVVAYERRTGTPAWSALEEQQAYASPMLVTLAGVRQILVFSASRLMGITPNRGEVLWEYPWKTEYDANTGQPLVIGDSRVFISTGYGTGAAVVEVSAADGRLSAREIWRNIRMKNKFTSSVLQDGFIYGLDESILACLDAATGELKWKGGRYGYGQVLLASGHLIVLSEDGDLALVRATPERHEEVVRFPVLEGKTWNHPAMADGYLLVRNINEMAAFDLRMPAAARR